jgi:hypothetical protein
MSSTVYQVALGVELTVHIGTQGDLFFRGVWRTELTFIPRSIFPRLHWLQRGRKMRRG